MQLTLGQRVEHMQQELDLPQEIVTDLLSVSGVDIVVVADDSGSMNAVANPGAGRRGDFRARRGADPRAASTSGRVQATCSR